MHKPAFLSRRSLAATLPIAALVGASSVAAAAAVHALPDPELEQIEQHRALRLAISNTSGHDDDPAYETACDVKEAALQALGDALPTSLGGARHSWPTWLRSKATSPTMARRCCGRS